MIKSIESLWICSILSDETYILSYSWLSGWFITLELKPIAWRMSLLGSLSKSRENLNENDPSYWTSLMFVTMGSRALEKA
jgi:hypothetical protein